MAAYRAEIDQFIQHFAEQKREIENVKPLLFRKVLYAAALDPLARAAFGSVGNRKRMVRLIDELTSWGAKDRVSLPQLGLLLKERKRGRFRLYRHVAALLREWSPGQILRLDTSPERRDLESFASLAELVALEKCRYAELFYTYRNNLVHELREPGYGIEMSSDGTQPYYHSYINGPWELVFPMRFFSGVYDEALANLKLLLISQRRSPFGRFTFGSLWS